MAYLIIVGGLFLGLIIFLFTFIASKRTGNYHLAPLITFLFSGVIVAYGLFIVRGFEGMGYLLLAAGFFIISIVGTLFLPLLTRKSKFKSLNKRDKVSLVLLPILFFAAIGLAIYAEEGYWIIDEGSAAPVEVEGYRISTISEGRKQITLLLGDDYLGKTIEVERVSKRGPTEIILKIEGDGEENKVPFIQIGISEITEPLKVETTEGAVLEKIGSEIGD